jgi:hypothetical protein
MVDQRFVARGLVALALLFVGVANAGCSHAAVPSIVEGTGGLSAVNPHLVRGPASYYVSLPAFGVIDQVDPATGQVFNTFFAPGMGLMLADSVRGQVFGISGDAIAVIGTVFQHNRATIRLPEAVVSWALASRAERLYVAGAQTVYVISTASDTIIATVAMPSPIGAITASPEHHRVFVTMPATNRIGVIDTPADVLDKRPIFEGACNRHPCDAVGITASANGRYVVALSTSDSFSIGIDAASDAILSKTQLSCHGRSPRFIGQNDANGLGWILPCEFARGESIAPISLQPPFGNLPFSDSFNGNRVTIQAAFDPSGAGYAIGVCDQYCRGNFLLSISTTNGVQGLGELPSTPGGIAYAPVITR